MTGRTDSSMAFQGQEEEEVVAAAAAAAAVVVVVVVEEEVEEAVSAVSCGCNLSTAGAARS